MISEPMTMLSDYALAGISGWLGWRLFRSREGQTARLCWTLFFAGLSSAAVLGGSYHGFAQLLSERTEFILWKTTVLTIGIASFWACAGSAFASSAGIARRLLLAFAAAKLTIYSSRILANDSFVYVIADTAVTMTLVAALHGWSALRDRDLASRWMVGGVCISAVGAGVQLGKFSLHPDFNHNDLYHVLQIAAIALVYIGAGRLTDRSRHRTAS